MHDAQAATRNPLVDDAMIHIHVAKGMVSVGTLFTENKP